MSVVRCQLIDKESKREIKNNLENPRGWSYTQWDNSAKKSKHFDSFKVYIIKCYDEKEFFYKIGRTYNTVNKRFSSSNLLPYFYEIVSLKIFDNAYECCEYEVELKNKLKEFKYTPLKNFKGKGECFKQLNNSKMYGDNHYE